MLLFASGFAAGIVFCGIVIVVRAVNAIDLRLYETARERNERIANQQEV